MSVQLIMEGVVTLAPTLEGHIDVAADLVSCKKMASVVVPHHHVRHRTSIAIEVVKLPYMCLKKNPTLLNIFKATNTRD